MSWPGERRDQGAVEEVFHRERLPFPEAEVEGSWLWGRQQRTEHRAGMVRGKARGRRLSKLSKGLSFILGCVGSSEDLNMGGPTFHFHGGGRLTQRGKQGLERGVCAVPRELQVIGRLSWRGGA